MNGLQIIKTLALKIRYASIVEWYNFWSIVLQHHQNIVPTVASIDETIRHITEGNRSISRFGDGEMLLTSPSKSIGFQEGSPLLAKRLREVLVSHEEGHLVAIPDVFSGLNRYRRKCRRFQRTHFFIYGKWWDQLLIRTKIRKRISLTPLYGLYIQGTLRTLVSGTQDHLGRTRHRVHRRRNEPTWSRKRPF